MSDFWWAFLVGLIVGSGVQLIVYWFKKERV